MTNIIFDELKTKVKEEHTSGIADVKRHILIDETIRDKCSDFLKKAEIIGINKYSIIVAFIKYKGEFYIGIDSRHAEKFESSGYTIEEKKEILVGSQILCLAEKLYELKADSKELIHSCLGLEPVEGADSVVFSTDDILELIYDISVFSIGFNTLELIMDSQDDLRRLLLLLRDDANIQLSSECNEKLLQLAAMSVTKKISNNLLDFVFIGDNKIRFLALYQCIEYLSIPNRASEFKEKYNMNIADALRLHIKEGTRSTERDNIMAVLKQYAGTQIIDRFHYQLFEENESLNQLERVNNWIYELRCSIAHFRYGQIKEDNLNSWNDIFVLMLELLVSIYNNINEDIRAICNGKIIV